MIAMPFVAQLNELRAGRAGPLPLATIREGVVDLAQRRDRQAGEGEQGRRQRQGRSGPEHAHEQRTDGRADQEGRRLHGAAQGEDLLEVVLRVIREEGVERRVVALAECPGEDRDAGDDRDREGEQRRRCCAVRSE